MSGTIRFVISADSFHAVVFDLDGVVTKTAKTHAAAWKRLFDEYLQEQAACRGEGMRPFDIDDDYRQYVDGKPRYEGVRSFLESRGIKLSYGSPGDEPGTETVCGLGNRKNRYFLELLNESGVEAYDSSVRLIRDLRSRGSVTAIVSSSKNCRGVLEAAGLTGLFDAKVDGKDSERLGLAGKPAPDIFLEAARRLEVDPAHSVVVEDSLAGVEAGRRGRFGCVIGVDRGGLADALRDNGADVVVSDLSEIGVSVKTSASAGDNGSLPSALQRIDEINSQVRGRRLIVFLDYDGTLTPIVRHPDDAILSGGTRSILKDLARPCTVAVISGRDLRDVRERVGIAGLFYAGSHGFEMAGPKGWRLDYQVGLEYLPALDRVQQELQDRLGEISGAIVERKRFSLAIHYRMVADDDVARVKDAVDQAAARHSELRRSSGRKVFELQPGIDWDKGKAVLRLLEGLSLDSSEFIPLYIGDDVTDEDAFRAIRSRGIGIVVMESPRPTAAQYALENPVEVCRFLQTLASSTLAEVTW